MGSEVLLFVVVLVVAAVSKSLEQLDSERLSDSLSATTDPLLWLLVRLGDRLEEALDRFLPELKEPQESEFGSSSVLVFFRCCTDVRR